MAVLTDRCPRCDGYCFIKDSRSTNIVCPVCMGTGNRLTDADVASQWPAARASLLSLGDTMERENAAHYCEHLRLVLQLAQEAVTARLPGAREKCTSCAGDGFITGHRGNQETCPVCNGSGKYPP